MKKSIIIFCLILGLVGCGTSNVQEDKTKKDTEKSAEKNIKKGTELTMLKEQAKAGIVDAQYELANLYYTGSEGAEQSFEKAVQWYEKAAKKGHAVSQFYLSAMYTDGTGVKKDLDKTFEWTKKAAEQGLAEAEYNLGYMFETGEGVKQNYQEALKWYEKAAEQGLPIAVYSIGDLYISGNGVPVNKEKSYAYVTVAADLENELMGEDTYDLILENLEEELSVEELLGAEKYINEYKVKYVNFD